jgi:GT2 family glycosyltransferase
VPRVSIGLPVYNGENFLADAIGSVLTQSYGDLELVICDNASTDRTETIARDFAGYATSATSAISGRRQTTTAPGTRAGAACSSGSRTTTG